MEQMVKDFISHLFKDDSEKLNFFIDKKWNFC
jgi:hypothetical protein